MGSSPPSCLLFLVQFFLFFNFNIPSLSSSSYLPAKNVTLFGDAYFRDNAISLTQEFGCKSSPSSSSSGVGRAFYAYPIRFLDYVTNSTASFSCRFSFSITPSSLRPAGDGIAFLITFNTESFSTSRGYMGLPEQALIQQDPFVAVEFDTSYDPSLGDISENHVGIDIRIISFASVDVSSSGIDLKSGRLITAWIEYSDALKMIRGSSLHIIGHWRFKTFGSLPSVIPMDSAEEGDCFICFSVEEPSVINASISAGDPPRRKNVGELAFGLAGLAAFLFSALAILAVVFFLFTKGKRFEIRKREEGLACRIHTTRVPAKLSLAEIKSATMAFNRSRIIGEGASATVYRGSLPFGGEVAVKRFERLNGIECMRNPFATEFPTMMGCLRHKNLVQLQGWCCERSELVLVYEYLPNGSLGKILHKRSNSAVTLSWKQRLNIVLGVASALTYLQEECQRQIIHRDFKTCNIMLDAEFNAKLGDFGKIQ
ncbi:L-type lectin-domain containing receptor kinase S.6 [Morella rubra]|uniref:L-type lectin-domain containing receptor kinase S.6 n=1 Tax=Morella rubra TaxID=262757 RepID=A0A6A1VU42_9ROSI|nr:L-type lectin-domain containing receptor kinase S.6 [Morella rubra]